MPNWLNRLRAPAERKSLPQSLVALTGGGEASWSRRGFVSLATEGFIRNPVVHRCVRMIAEAANAVPLAVEEGGRRLGEHPALALLKRPNPRQSGAELMEAVYAYLQTAGNAYLEAAVIEGEVRGLFCLRPDRMRVIAGRDGWPGAYAYSAGGATRTLSQEAAPIPKVLHLALFHPLDDHYGLSPLEAAQQSMDIHNAAARWNKALLDNAARPSGALVYSAQGGQLTPDQFARLKSELLGAGLVLGLLQQDPAAWFARGAAYGDDARIQALIDERTAAKKARDFARADAIRQQLADEGILLEDTPQGVRWKRA